MDWVAWVALGIVLIGVVFDVRTREVPDWVSIVLLAWALLATGFAWPRPGWQPVSWPALGIGLAVALGVGLVLFYVLKFGGADVKLLAALGAVMGWHKGQDVVPLLFWTAVSGGLLSLIARLRGQRDLAYTPAIALGLFVVIVLRELRNAQVF